MNKDFPRIMTLLRKERKLSQKQVAADLDVTQALLSHYENGKRECGLDFLVKAADYYNVSCDYLLGRSADRSGLTMTAEELPGFKAVTEEEAANWVPTDEDIENGAFLIYGFDAEGNMLSYATLMGAPAIKVDPGKMPHNNMYY